MQMSPANSATGLRVAAAILALVLVGVGWLTDAMWLAMVGVLVVLVALVWLGPWQRTKDRAS
jgi:hypothetical protein